MMSPTLGNVSVRARCLAAPGPNAGQRILAVDVPVAEPQAALRAEHDGAVALRPDEQPAHVGVRTQGIEQRRVAVGDLLQRHPVLLAQEVDEPQVPGTQHGDVARADGRRCLLPTAVAGRLAQGRAHHGGALVAVGDALDVARGQRAPHQLVERVAVALLEGRALGLAVVREDDDLVRPRRVLAGPLEPAELLVELAQRLERVGTLEPGVVGDLVVARERRVHGGTAGHHVGEHAVHDQVAHDDAHAGADERVGAAAMTPRPDVAADRLQRRHPLEDDLAEEQHQHPRHVVGAGQEVPVAGVGPLLVRDAADREDGGVGLPGEQVAAAGATVDEQADAGREAPLDLDAVVGRRARHDPAGLLLDPAERGDVVVRAEQDPGLAGTRLRRQVGLPAEQLVRVVGEPARHHRRVPVAHRAAQHRQRQAVDLQVEDARHVGVLDLARPGGRCAACAAGRTSRRRPLRRAPARTVVTAATTSAAASAQPKLSTCTDSIAFAPMYRVAASTSRTIRKPEHDRQRQPQRRHQRRHDRVQDRDRDHQQQRVGDIRHVEAGQDPGREQHGGGRDDRTEDQPDRRQPGPAAAQAAPSSAESVPVSVIAGRLTTRCRPRHPRAALRSPTSDTRRS